MPLTAIEQRIVDYVKAQNDPVNPAEVVREIAQQGGASEAEARAAIWRLTNVRVFELTPDLKLRPDHEEAAA